MYPLPAFVLLSMIQYRYVCRIFERKCLFDDVFSLLEVDQVNIKYVSRVTQSRFFVNYVTNTTYTNRMSSGDVSYAPSAILFC